MDVRKLLSGLPKEKTDSFLCEELESLKKNDGRMYKRFVDRLYTSSYGSHFNEELYREAVELLPTGEHWSFREIGDYTSKKGLKYDDGFNEYDFAYVMNLLYSEYHEIIANTDMYYAMAKAFLAEPRNRHGKAYRYYRCLEDCE